MLTRSLRRGLIGKQGPCRYNHTEEGHTGLRGPLTPGLASTWRETWKPETPRGKVARAGQWQQKLDRCRDRPLTTKLGRDLEGFFLELQREPGPAYTLTLDF